MTCCRNICPVFMLALWVLTSCVENEQQTKEIAGVKYAKRFDFHKKGDTTFITVTPDNETPPYKYTVVSSASHTHKSDGSQTILAPLSSIVCASTTHVPMLASLGKAHTLIGFPGLHLITSPAVRKQIRAGKVMDIGIEYDLDMEKLVALQPEAFMTYPNPGGAAQLRQVKAGGIPVIMNADYLEEHPLGRAEWIRFFAILFGEEALGDSLFSAIESAYLGYVQTVPPQTRGKTVISGLVFGDAWYAPGGNSYMSRLFLDAGFTYIWSQNEHTGSFPIPIETAFAEGRNADMWIGLGDIASVVQLTSRDARYARFQAVQQHQAYTYYRGNKAGSPFLELGYLRPDLILQDLVAIRTNSNQKMNFFSVLQP